MWEENVFVIILFRHSSPFQRRIWVVFCGLVVSRPNENAAYVHMLCSSSNFPVKYFIFETIFKTTISAVLNLLIKEMGRAQRFLLLKFSTKNRNRFLLKSKSYYIKNFYCSKIGNDRFRKIIQHYSGGSEQKREKVY